MKQSVIEMYLIHIVFNLNLKNLDTKKGSRELIKTILLSFEEVPSITVIKKLWRVT